MAFDTTQGVAGSESTQSSSATAPGKRTRSESLPVQRRAAATAESPAGATSTGGGQPADDVFSMHLLGTEGAAPAAAGGYTPPVEIPPSGAELDALEQQHEHQAAAPVDAPKDPEGTGKDEKKPPPDMTGIGSTVAVGRFVTAAKDVQKDWGSLKTDERADKLGKAANDELKAADVYETTPKVEDLGTFAGEFHFGTWILGLGKDPFSAASVTDDEAADIGATVYHEARHAEQWHRMARVLAGQGKKADAIKTELSIPAKVAADAYGKPIKDTTTPEGKEASAWYDGVYGTKRTERNDLFTKVRPKYRKVLDEAQAAYEKLLADKSATKEKKDEAAVAYKKAYADYQREYYAKYRALVEEADAWAVEDKMKGAYKKK